MTAKELIKLQRSNEAPFNHVEYTIWLHNKIVDKINYDLWQFREQKSMNIKSPYAACNDIMSFDSLKRVD